MNRKLRILSFVCLLLVGPGSQLLHPQRIPEKHRLANAEKAAYNLYGELWINRIQMNFMNLGGLNINAQWKSRWDGWNEKYLVFDMVFDQGLWVTGKRNGAVGCLPYVWGSAYSPGPIINGQAALKVRPQDSIRYRVYGVTRGDTPALNPDLTAWPSDLGAPSDSTGKPAVRGDQMLWMVYNGADTTAKSELLPSRFYSAVPRRTVLPVEVRHTVFEHFGEMGDTTIWANVVFLEWAIYNKGPDLLDSVYFSLWTDIDFYDAQFTIPAIDTIAQTGYCWYGKNPAFGSVGYALLHGPIVRSPGDTAIFFGRKKKDSRNLPLSSFYAIFDDSGSDGYDGIPPYSQGTAWNVVRGLRPNGLPMIDSVSRQPTKFPYSGDPITRRGSIYPFGSYGVGGGAGFMFTTGPCSIAPGDSQWVMMALIPSNSLNGTDAINRMRANAAYLQSLPYDSLITPKARRSVPINPLPVFDIPTSFAMRQNYPNPFNAGTIIPYELPEMSRVHIEIFDMLGRPVAAFADQVLERGYRSINWNPSMAASGIYLVRVNAKSVESSKVWDGTSKIVLVK